MTLVTWSYADLSALFDDGSAVCSSSQDDNTVDGDREAPSGSCSVFRSAPTSNMWWVKRHELRMKFVMSISIGANSSQTLFTASSTSCLLTRHPAVRLWYNPVCKKSQLLLLCTVYINHTARTSLPSWPTASSSHF